MPMSAALSQLKQAQSLAEALSSAAEIAKAELADLQTQKALLSEALTVYSARGNKLAVYGFVHPKIRKVMDIDQEVFYADLNWNAILSELGKHKVQYAEISKFPEVKRDLALLIDKNVTFAEIEKIAYETERKLLKKVTLFDVYEGKNLEAGKKSYAVSFILQDETKTLTDAQIEGIMKKMLGNFENKLGAKLR